MSVHYKIEVDVDEAKRKLDSLQKKFAKVAETHNDPGDFFGKLSDAVREGNSELDKLKKTIDKVSSAIDKMPDGSEKEAAIKAIGELRKRYAQLSETVAAGEKGLKAMRTAMILGGTAMAGAAIAAGALIIAVRAATKESREMGKAIEAGFSQSNKQMATALANYTQAQALWQSAGGSVERLNEILVDHRDILDKSGVSIENINDGNTAFIEQTDAVIGAIKQRIVAMAMMKAAEVAAEKAGQEYLNAEKKIQKMEAKRTSFSFRSIYDRLIFGKRQNGEAPEMEQRYYESLYEDKRQKATEKADPYLQIAMNLSKASIDAMNEEMERLEALGLTTTSVANARKKNNKTVVEAQKELQKEIERLEKYAQALEALEQIQEKNTIAREREQRKISEQIEQASIDALPEGEEKRRRQRELNEQKELQAIYDAKDDYVRAFEDRARAEWEAQQRAYKLANKDYQEQAFDPSSVQIDTSGFDRLIEATQKRQKVARQRQYEELLRDFETYKQAEERINREYDDKIAQMNPDDAGNIEKANRQRKKALSALKAEQLAESGVMKALLGDLSTVSTETLKKYIDTAVELLENTTDLTAQDMKVFLDAIRNAREEVTERNPFKSLRESYLKYIEARRSGKKDEEGVALRDFQNASNASAAAIEKIGGSLSSLSSLFGEGGENISEAINAVASSMSDATKAIAAFSRANTEEGGFEDTLEGITSAVSAIVTIASFSKKISDYETSEGMRKWQDLNDFAREYEVSLSRLKAEDYETIFGTKTISKTADAYKKMLEALEKYKDAFSSSGGLPTDIWVDADSYFKTAGAAKYNGDLRDMAVRTKKSFWNFLLPGKWDKYERLSDLNPELFTENGDLNVDAAKAFLQTNTQITEEQRKQIQYVIDLKDAYEEASAALDNTLESILGNIGSDLTDIIWDSVMEGADAWEGFKEKGSDAIAAIGKQLIQEMLISEYLEQFKDQMRNAYSLGSPAEVQSELRSIVGNIFGGMQTMLDAGSAVAEEYKSWAEKIGFDLTSGGKATERTAASKALTGVNQESFDEALGRFTAIQSHTYDINETTKSIREAQANLLAVTNMILSEVRGIHADTQGIYDRLDNIDGTTEVMRSNLSQIADKGVRMLN